MSLDVIPTGKSLGAEIRGLDLTAELSDRNRKTLIGAWHEHLVLLIRGQPVTDEQLIAFSRNFGELQFSPRSEVNSEFGAYDKLRPEITVISNIVEHGKAIGSLGAGEATWHTDMSYMDEPISASLLHALEIPPSGGNTYFTNMYAAYETLDEDVRRRVEGRLAIHDYTYTSAGDIREGFAPVDDVTQAPGARHPVVRTHPETGRKALYLGRRRNGYIIGLPVPESEELLDRLWSHAVQPDFVWGHEWRVGDLLIWDNRCVMHRRDPFDPASRRLMHRTQIKGERPV